MAQTTTKPTTDIDDIELFHPDIDTDDTPQTDTALKPENDDEHLAGPGAAFAAAMDLAVTGAHVDFVASGEKECLTGHCSLNPEFVTVLDGVL
jgi:hypothetical protein